MKKSEIKEILRESLIQINEEKEKKKKKKNYTKNYGELQRKLDGTMLKASQVMAAAGLGDPDNATDRSLFSKKLRREKNDEGGVYQFDDKELASVIKVINNPASYLNVKK
jgi:hypothetical protein